MVDVLFFHRFYLVFETGGMWRRRKNIQWLLRDMRWIRSFYLFIVYSKTVAMYYPYSRSQVLHVCQYSHCLFVRQCMRNISEARMLIQDPFHLPIGSFNVRPRLLVVLPFLFQKKKRKSTRRENIGWQELIVPQTKSARCPIVHLKFAFTSASRTHYYFYSLYDFK